MALFGFIGKKRAKTVPLRNLGLQCDMHSHLIPNVDDGSDSLQKSIELINGLKNAGYKKLIVTPHVMTGFFNNDTKTITHGLQVLKEELVRQNVDIEIDVAAEYYIDYDFMQDLSRKPMLTIGNNKMLLFECSFVNRHRNFDETVFEMQVNGYTPVLAHPERYTYWHGNINHMRTLHDRGILFQINILSLAKAYSREVNYAAKELINNGLVDFIGTDLHNIEQLKIIGNTQISENTFNKLMELELLNNKLL